MARFIKELPLGSVVIDYNTIYLNEPIKWMLIDKNYNGINNTVTLQAVDLISPKAFDALETMRPVNGYNVTYKESNIRQWLNSNETNWFTQMSANDEPPITSLLVNCIGYDNEIGFLANFSDALKSSLIINQVKTVLSNGNLDITNDLIYIPSFSQIFGGANREGINFRYYSTQERRMKIVSIECYNYNKDYCSDITFISGQNYYQMLRTRSTDTQCLSVLPQANGAIDLETNLLSCISPVITLNDNTIVSSLSDIDGSYILFEDDPNSQDGSKQQRIRLRQVEGGKTFNTLKERLEDIEARITGGFNFIETDTILPTVDEDTHSVEIDVKISPDADNGIEIKSNGLYTPKQKTRSYYQATPVNVWVVNHGFQFKYPDVKIIDTSGNILYANIDYTTDNMLLIKFDIASNGTAYLSTNY